MYADILKKNGMIDYHVFTNDVNCNDIRRDYGDEFNTVLTVVKDGCIIFRNYGIFK